MSLSARPNTPSSKVERPSLGSPQRLSHEEQKSVAADVKASEIADRAQEDPDAILQSAEISPDAERLASLEAWSEDHFPGLLPSSTVAKALLQIEHEEAEAGFPEFKATDEDPSDLRAEVEFYLAEHALEQKTALAQTEIEDGVPAKVPAEVGQQSSLIAEEQILDIQNAQLRGEQPKLSAKDTDRKDKVNNAAERNETAQAELEMLQTEFLILKTELGTEAALHRILAKTTIPEAQRHIRDVLGTLKLLKTALPGKSEALAQLFNRANLDLSATSVTASFANIIVQAERSSNFTPNDVAAMRQVIAKQSAYVRTGTNLQTELSRTQTDENGQEIPAHPKDDPLRFREHVAGYTEPNGSQYLKAETTHGDKVKLNITGWSGADVGCASEMLQLWALTENEGQTDYLTSMTKLNWSGTARIDPFSLQRASQVVSALLGGGEGHDGDIFDDRDAIGLIRWQAQLANHSGATLRGRRDAKQSNDGLVGLGIKDKDGNLDLDVLRAFGEYSRDHSHTMPDYEAVRAHLTPYIPSN